MNWNPVIISFITGALVGAIFRIARLPVPAPDSLAGLMGIVGIFVGYMLLKALGI
ncbi:MAG: DUF1427 family protein [Candidatus Diapherotrites archaeon]|nr:DUF1427 family protein [Candidatus Diapherotrites archaeon]